MMIETKVPFYAEYKNWQDHVSVRHLVPLYLWFGENKFHEGAQWLLHAYDIEKGQLRDFALSGFRSETWKPSTWTIFEVIAADMLRAGMPAAQVEPLLALTKKSEGIQDLFHLWKEGDEREEVEKDLIACLRDRGLL